MRTYTDKSIAKHMPLTREQKRREARAKVKGQAVHNVTAAQMDQIKKEITLQAINQSYIMMLGFPLMALRDEFGFGHDRLERMMKKMLSIMEAMEKGYVTLEDLRDTIKAETGLEYWQLLDWEYDKANARVEGMK